MPLNLKAVYTKRGQLQIKLQHHLATSFFFLTPVNTHSLTKGSRQIARDQVGYKLGDLADVHCHARVNRTRPILRHV